MDADKLLGLKGPQPLITEELMNYLNKLYPERCPDPRHNDREIWMRAGERRVVRFLQSVFDGQDAGNQF